MKFVIVEDIENGVWDLFVRYQVKTVRKYLRPQEKKQFLQLYIATYQTEEFAKDGIAKMLKAMVIM